MNQLPPSPPLPRLRSRALSEADLLNLLQRLHIGPYAELLAAAGPGLGSPWSKEGALGGSAPPPPAESWVM